MTTANTTLWGLGVRCVALCFIGSRADPSAIHMSADHAAVILRGRRTEAYVTVRRTRKEILLLVAADVKRMSKGKCVIDAKMAFGISTKIARRAVKVSRNATSE